MKRKQNVILSVLVFFLLVGTLFLNSGCSNETYDSMEIEGEMSVSIDEMRDDFISLKNSMQQRLRHDHKYRCCLEKSCTYCIEKTPGHGEGATCDCLKDVIKGVHPCGECIGEILEGHGNPYLSEYFGRAIAEKTGQEDAIKLIIKEKYGISVEDQI